MLHSRLKRPLFRLLIAAILLICLARRKGFLDAGLPIDLIPYLAYPAITAEAKLESSPHGIWRLSATALARRIEGHPCRLRLMVRLPPEAGQAGLKSGSLLRLLGRLQIGRRARNPGDFDERAALSSQGLAGIFSTSRFEILGTESSGLGRISAEAEDSRLSLRRMLENTYPQQQAAVLSGILLGDKGTLDPPFAEALKRAGAFHLIVPSGTNVTFVLVFFLWLTRRLGLPSIAQWLIPPAMAGFYGLMLGCDPPYLRAYFCALLAAAVRLWGREYDLFQALIISALTLLCGNPRLLFQPGFQMSYLTVLGLWLAQPQKWAPGHWPPWLRLAIGLAAASVIAQAAIFPLLAQMEGKLSLAAIFSNILLVPLCGVILGAGYALWGISLISRCGLFTPAAVLTGWTAALFRQICFTAAGLPAAAFDLTPLSSPAIFGYYLALSGLLSRRRRGLPLVSFGLILMLSGPLREMLFHQDLRVTALSLRGPGSSWIHFPDGRIWLVYGSGAPGLVLRALKFKGIERVDQLIFLENSPARRMFRQRLNRAFPTAKIVSWKERRPFEICSSRICFRFGPTGPRVYNGRAEYSALPGRLRRQALDIASDGVRAAWASSLGPVDSSHRAGFEWSADAIAHWFWPINF